MTITHQDVRTSLESAASQLASCRAPIKFARELEKLAAQADEPCVVAVVGRVKAGKSTFINALLGQDLAKVGVSETTATVNRFVYGTPDDPSRPIRCYWEGGRVTHERPQFLDQLQGNSQDSLRQAEGIDCLEYLLPAELLREVTLVDTPGTGSVVSDHTQRSADFLLRQQLATRNTKRSEQIRRDADAVVYLVGAVPHSNDRDFLNAFDNSPEVDSKASNIVGVMSKTDLYPGVLDRREELCHKIAAQTEGGLDVVLPVSASLERVLDVLAAADDGILEQFSNALQSIPFQQVQFFLENEAFFLEEETFECPLSVSERRNWHGKFTKLLGRPVPWSTFALIARTAANPESPPHEISEKLRELSGFRPLFRVLRQRFFHRSRLLRCTRIVRDAQALINQLRFEELPAMEQSSHQNSARLLELNDFIESAAPPEDIRMDLERLVRAEYDIGARVQVVRDVWKELDEMFGELWHRLDEENGNIRGLQLIDDHANMFSSNEVGELRALFGQYGSQLEKRLLTKPPELDAIRRGQLRWKQKAAGAFDKPRRMVCTQAQNSYANILYCLRNSDNY